MTLAIGDSALFFLDQDDIDNDTPKGARILAVSGATCTIEWFDAGASVISGPVPAGGFTWTSTATPVPIEPYGAPVAFSVTPVQAEANLDERVAVAQSNVAQRCLVWRQGGPTASSFYDDLEDLETALAAISGEIVVVVDSSFTPAPTIDKTIYWNQAILSGSNMSMPSFTTQIGVNDGVKLVGLKGLQCGLTITGKATSVANAPISDMYGGQVFEVRQNCQVVTTGGGPFFDLSSVPDGELVILKLDEIATLGSFGFGDPVVYVPDNKFLAISGGEQGDVLTDAIESTALGTLLFQWRSATASLALQTGLAGSLVHTYLHGPRFSQTIVDAVGVNSGGSLSLGQFARLSADNTGAVQHKASAFLPPFLQESQGARVMASCTATSTGYAELVPDGTDTINGVNAPYRLDAGQSVALMQGNSGWETFAGGNDTALPGRGPLSVNVAAEQTTTIQSPAFAVAATLVLPADLFGVWDVVASCAVGNASASRETTAELHDVTDDVVLDGSRVVHPTIPAARTSEVWRAQVTMAGLTKTVTIRFNTSNSNRAAAINSARITARRIA